MCGRRACWSRWREGRLLTFEVRAYDEAGLIGQGTHTRCIISEDRFMQKAQSRLETK